MSVWSKLKGAFVGDERVDISEATAATARFVWSRDMQLRVAAPQGGGWQLAEGGEAGDLLCAFRCARGEGSDALVLHAKVFAVPEGKQKKAEELRGEDWKAQWLASTFAEIDQVKTEVVGHMVEGFRHDACEVRVTGKGKPPMGALTVRERQLPAGDRLLVLTAAGSPTQHEAHAGVIEAWISNTTHAT